MPANVRIRCKYIDCQFLNGLYCGAKGEIEIDRKKGCLTYLPIKAEIGQGDDLVDEDEELEEDEEWVISEDELEDEEEESSPSDAYGEEE